MTGMSDLADWKPEWRDAVFANIQENPQHQFLFLSKRPDLLAVGRSLKTPGLAQRLQEKQMCGESIRCS